MHKNTVDDVLKLNPEKIVYISCNPITIVRDINLLTEGKYKLVKIRPVDMLPHTYHIENTDLLVKNVSFIENNSLIDSAFFSIIKSIIKKDIIRMTQITANDLKTKGVSLLKKEIVDDEEVIITVRGKNKYVILPMEKYNYLRECELETALKEVKKDLKEGNYIKESVEKHIKRITNG